MNKMKLVLDHLQVESFAITTQYAEKVGTVRARSEFVTAWECTMEEFCGAESGVHTHCFSHCPAVGCAEEPLESAKQTHCVGNCPSWTGGCVGCPPGQ